MTIGRFSCIAPLICSCSWAAMSAPMASDVRSTALVVTSRLAGQSTLEAPTAQLPRLAASQDEVESAARAWNPDSRSARMLIGKQASLTDLNAALALRPSIVHFAAHVLPNPKALGRAYIALSLASDGAP